jgi:hypothetical protein
MTKKKISIEEQSIIAHAVKNADVFGLGRLTSSQEQIEDSGFVWTDDHEEFALEYNWDDETDPKYLGNYA